MGQLVRHTVHAYLVSVHYFVSALVCRLYFRVWLPSCVCYVRGTVCSRMTCCQILSALSVYTLMRTV